MSMNIIISAIVGALASTTVMVGGVTAVKCGQDACGEPAKVSNEKLYSYSDQ